MIGPQQLRERLAAQGVHTLIAQFTDLPGVAKGKLLPLAQLDTLLATGAGFFRPVDRGHRSAAARPALGVLRSR